MNSTTISEGDNYLSANVNNDKDEKSEMCIVIKYQAFRDGKQGSSVEEL